MRTLTTLATLAGLLLATSAHAALVEVRLDSSPLQQKTLNYPSPNAPAKPILTLDTLSGHKWLDVNLTRGYSYNTIVAELQNTRSDFYGFRIATMTEVLQLFRNHFTFTTFSNSMSRYTGENYYTNNAVIGSPEWYKNQKNIDTYGDFYYKFGNNRDIHGAVSSGFYLNDSSSGVSSWNRQLLMNVSHSEDLTSSSHSSIILYNWANSYSADYSSSGIGWMLIHEPMDVSTPPFAAAMLLLAFGWRSRQSSRKQLAPE